MDAKDINGRTAVYFAASDGQVEAIRTLKVFSFLIISVFLLF